MKRKTENRLAFLHPSSLFLRSLHIAQLGDDISDARGELLWQVPTEPDDVEATYILEPDHVTNFWTERSFQPHRILPTTRVVTDPALP